MTSSCLALGQCPNVGSEWRMCTKILVIHKNVVIPV